MFATKRFFAFSSLCLAALLAYAPASQAACSCLCMDAADGSGPAPSWECSADTFVIEPEPATCQQMQCAPIEPDPVVEDVTDTGTTTTDTSTDPVVAENDAVDAPEAGMTCRYRHLYRPDLGKYKRTKVCRLSDEARKEKMQEKWAAFEERHPDIAQKYKDHISRLKAKHAAKSSKKHHWHDRYDKRKGRYTGR